VNKADTDPDSLQDESEEEEEEY